MPTIRIDNQVWEELKKQAEPFVDTPNDVLRRLLHLDGPTTRSNGRVGQPAEIPTKMGTSGRQIKFPRENFYTPILQSLVELGGRVRVDEVLQRVHTKVARQLGPPDLAVNRSGEPNWRNSARWARERMVKEESPALLNPSAPYGWWEITQAGRDYLSNNQRSP